MADWTILPASAEMLSGAALPDITSYYVIGTRPEVLFGPSAILPFNTTGGGYSEQNINVPGEWATVPMFTGTVYNPSGLEGSDVPGVWASNPIPTEGAYFMTLYRPVINIAALPITQTTYSWG